MGVLLAALLLQGDAWDDGFSVGLRARVSAASGEAGPGLEYGDLFHSGFGAELEASHLWRSGAAGYGFFASAGLDRFAGRTYSDDPGDALRPEPLDVAPVLGGLRLEPRPRVRDLTR
jgi:hypothetical protein